MYFTKDKGQMEHIEKKFLSVKSDVMQGLHSSDKKWEEPWSNVKRPTATPIPVLDEVIKRTNVKIAYINLDMAAYCPPLDTLILPKPVNFRSDQLYYASLFHELGHWTGHPRRLNRESLLEYEDNLENEDNLKSYVLEELTAEFNSAFICGLFGICPVEHHQNYIRFWMNQIGGNKSILDKATIEATKAAKYILNGGQ